MITKFKRQEKDFWQNVFLQIILALSILIVVGLLAVSNWKVNQRRFELSSKIQSLQKEIKRLELEKEALEAKGLESLNESYLEKEARERFNLKKPGEEVVTIISPQENNQTTTEKGKVWWNPFSW